MNLYTSLYLQLETVEKLLDEKLHDRYGDGLAAPFSLERFCQEEAMDDNTAKYLKEQQYELRQAVLSLAKRERVYKEFHEEKYPGTRVKWTRSLASLRPRNQRFLDLEYK